MKFGRFTRFVFVGAANTAFSYAVYALFLFLGLSYALANLISLIFGMMVGFETQRRFVFGTPEKRPVFRFIACWGFIYVVNIALIREIMALGPGPYAAGALALPAVVALSYTLQRYFVFQKSKIAAGNPSR
ncbi:MAG TPA: GtrA family protein [Blastocatellia bacterium]|nr:GtrA family protein [Blastocatellia bacterium]